MLLTICEFSLFSFFVICLLSLELEWKSRQTIIWSRNSKFAAWFACVNAKIKNKKHQQINQTIRNCFNVYCAQQLHKTIQTIKHATKQKKTADETRTNHPRRKAVHPDHEVHILRSFRGWWRSSQNCSNTRKVHCQRPTTSLNLFSFSFFFAFFLFFSVFFSLFHGFGIILKFKIKKKSVWGPCRSWSWPKPLWGTSSSSSWWSRRSTDTLSPGRTDSWSCRRLRGFYSSHTHTHKSQSSRGTFLLGPPLSHFVWRSEWWISKKYARIFLSFSRS